jgi:hypothetical protein
LSEYPYDYFQTGERDGYFYCLGLLTLFYAAGLTVQAEKHGNFGRADFILKYGEITRVVEIKVSHGDAGDIKLAAAALEQIKGKYYAGASPGPVLSGAVINDGSRMITAWECTGGIQNRPGGPATPENPAAPEKPVTPEKQRLNRRKGVPAPGPAELLYRR